MPRHPQVIPAIAAMGTSVYSALGHRLATHPGETYPLHVGDTWMEPADGCRMQDLTVAEHPGMHRYTSVRGLPALVRAVAERATRLHGVPTAPSNVLITAGATGGLAAICGAIVDPGDEVLILAPYWPLIAGAVRTRGGTPVEVPWFGHITDAASGLAALDALRTDRTVAVYLNTPHNPTGRLIPPEQLEAIAHWARKHDLWILADEVYEHYVFGDAQHQYTRPFAPERTFSCHSFSKAYGMAGNRCGYLVGPADAIDHVRKVVTNLWYSTPTAAQIAGLNALAGAGDAWAAKAATLYEATGRHAAKRLGVPAPEGSTFLFFDVAEALDDRGLNGLLSDCVDGGLLVGPGPAFGQGFDTHIRLCFTAVDPERTMRGVEVLAKLLGR
jgi:N-succinyldiaminopimelate aminotransferase